MAERWGALPLGELHPEDRCALCGYKPKPGTAYPASTFKRTILASTLARALICVDVVACERRRYKAKRLA